MYKDIIIKMEYHKEQILERFIKQGYFPKKEEIENKLEEINLRIALFKKYNFVPGEYFNTKEMNHCIKSLYYDLSFLYKILEDIRINEYNKILLNIETHMTYLESLADHYKKRANEEINGTSLGKTLLFQTNDWKLDVNDESVDVELKELELIQGTEVSCFANINNTDKKNILFKFTCNDSKLDFTALPYNYNNDTYIVPGEITVNNHDVKLSDSFLIKDEIKIPFDTNLFNNYKILGGKDKMMITNKETSKITITDLPTADKPFIADSNCFISFYVEGKGEIEYSFNKAPLHSNFSLQNGAIKIEKDIQKIFIDVEKGFVCYFDLKDNSTG